MPFMTHTYASSLVLITGVTGHIGFRVLLDALNSGYSVRAAVRSSEKAKSLSQHPKIFSIPNISSRLTFVVVPDLCRKHAYDEAARGCDFVIHIASPLMSNGVPAGSNQEDFFVKPAVRGTVNMLDAARKSGSVRRVVITSSITALIPIGYRLQKVRMRTNSRHMQRVKWRR
jgi:nucleoside-diphosphate-sugar epimerase